MVSGKAKYDCNALLVAVKAWNHLLLALFARYINVLKKLGLIGADHKIKY